MNKKQFIEKAINTHGDKYDYSLVDYKNSKTKVKIVCSLHGIFYQRASNHLLGRGCQKCGGSKKSNNKDFKDKANKVHNNKYNYSLVNYTNAFNKVKIICSEHGVFIQKPNTHLNGCVCPKCKISKPKNTTDYFIEKSKKIHGDKYDYSLSDYYLAKTKIKIICPEHGIFYQEPRHHIRGVGCPKCRKSKGEMKISKILNKINITFEEQKSFKNCKNIKLLKFDFYLPELNSCVEFDGEQHFMIKEIWGGEDEFKNIQIRDQIKNEFCKNNNIKLLRIKYNENIHKKLTNFLF